jgi:hypothetical protein
MERETFWSAAPTATALRTPSRRRQRFRHSRVAPRANNRCRRADSCGQRKRRLKSPHSKSRVPPRQPRTAEWNARLFGVRRPQAPLYGRLRSDANGSGTQRVAHASQQPSSSSRLVRPAKAAPEVAALQKPHAAQPAANAEWNARLFGVRRHSDRFTDAFGATPTVPARACGAASQQPLSSSRLVRPAKAAPEVAALQKPLPPRQPRPLNGRRAFWSAATRRRFTDALATTPTVPALACWHRRANNRCRRAESGAASESGA